MKAKLILSILSLFSLLAGAQNVEEIVRQADEKFRGESSRGTITMIIERSTWSREISMKNWTLGNEYSLIYITAPAKEKGQVFLKRKNEMWNWVPTIERMIKIPPSMMMQSWMGSDFTNDDLVRESSLVKDYTHKLAGEEMIQGYDCYKIELSPKPDAPVVWGKIFMWISKDKYFWLKAEYYDEDDYLVNTETLSEIKRMDDREMPTRLEMIPVDKEGQKTVLIFDEIEFNINLKESFFSQQNMRRIR
ncbi:outer membrane lipoprotein-sorting protein [Mariniphaga sediminis]|uniref:Outer membrane lipoprotein-sorting protein n=1 Tax=Mariniphaga sediminis TaxID=1628158 RepID=A0A399CV08_9BACT|nr:outer membrane lipoprotein-sorting protein [Mariniphaga sediminis]RIH62898.1 outer membrane lipoprotein-sorting protein [Mariniphaga sediminis]